MSTVVISGADVRRGKIFGHGQIHAGRPKTTRRQTLHPLSELLQLARSVNHLGVVTLQLRHPLCIDHRSIDRARIHSLRDNPAANDSATLYATLSLCCLVESRIPGKPGDNIGGEISYEQRW